jgi:hypothetical protein
VTGDVRTAKTVSVPAIDSAFVRNIMAQSPA